MEPLKFYLNESFSSLSQHQVQVLSNFITAGFVTNKNVCSREIIDSKTDSALLIL
jgi:hypothetical protein